MKTDLLKIFIDEINSKNLGKIYSTNKTRHSHNDESWSIGLADVIDYEISNNEGYRYHFIRIDGISKYI